MMLILIRIQVAELRCNGVKFFWHSETYGEVVPFGLRVLQAVPSGRLRVCKVRYALNRECTLETAEDLPPCRGLLSSSFAPSNPPVELPGLSPWRGNPIPRRIPR